MPNSATNISEFSDKIMKGVQKAIDDLVKANAEKDEDMVIGNIDGSFKIVPAKELLPPQTPEND